MRLMRCLRRGGVGINLAIQDAIAAANILVGPLRDGNSDRRRFTTRAEAARACLTRFDAGLQIPNLQKTLFKGVIEKAGDVRESRCL